MARKAVVLFNLGGPDTLAAVEPFLFNLFYDPAIIGSPNPLRYLVAKLISKRRAPIAKEIYKHLGGGSPLLPQTQDQAKALEDYLSGDQDEYKVFIAMRYWHPRAEKTVKQVANFDPDEVILLPLYPQYSTTTTGSSVEEWEKLAKKAKLNCPTTSLCCYPKNAGFVGACVDLIQQKLAEIEGEKPRLLFSAHGLPKKIVDAGDPYPWQVEQSVIAIVDKLGIQDLDYGICYQSRVGPVEWIKPATEDEISAAGADNKSLMIIPVAFVSEHSETLVELDIEYAELAKSAGVPNYYRIPTVTTHLKFIAGLGEMVKSLTIGQLQSEKGPVICPTTHGACECRKRNKND
ncbi:MAG: ferrochelatase [Sneathiella sp.]|nr:ferrochelatase [Sneathiella sp.]